MRYSAARRRRSAHPRFLGHPLGSRATSGLQTSSYVYTASRHGNSAHHPLRENAGRQLRLRQFTLSDPHLLPHYPTSLIFIPHSVADGLLLILLHKSRERCVVMVVSATSTKTESLRALAGDDVRQILWRFSDRFDLQML